MGGSYIRKKNSKVTNNVVFSSDLHQCKCVTELSRCDESTFRQTDRQGDLTCQRCVGEMLRLAALPFAVDDVEVDFN